jgi:hypothetical protein
MCSRPRRTRQRALDRKVGSMRSSDLPGATGSSDKAPSTLRKPQREEVY